MGKKRIIVEVNESEHRRLAEDARAIGMTVANYVRRAIDIPLERQGVKGTLSAPPKTKPKGTK